MKQNILLLLLLSAALLLVPACARVVAASPDASGEIEIVLSDYKFEPDVIRLKVGQTVHIKLRNEGSKMHEFMAGRDIQVHGNFTEGFGQDFFAGITPEISGPGMVMGGPEGMDMGGMDMGGEEMAMEGEEMAMGEEEHTEDEEHAEDEMAMGEEEHAEGEEHTEEEMAMEEGEHTEEEMAMGEEEHAEGDAHTEDDAPHTEEEMAMEEGEAHTEGDAPHTEGEGEEHEEEAVAGQFGAIQMPLMDAHAGLMVMIDPQMIPAGEETTITFTVPEDKVGRWLMGCFQERGQHYDDGMDGIIIVEE